MSGVDERKEIGKNDCYVEFWEDITVDQIKLIQQRIKWNSLGCRLYRKWQLQIYWDGCPRRNQVEFLYNLPAIDDVDQQVMLMNHFEKNEHKLFQ